ncbi:MAG: hypothetical protein A2X36_03650 [Elusimicrobia bacterium GWA2_69_24]|nr:MAG: hypothetical protein A2X36_03650 [Elusimicrobia bacterium GWA2_69_24]
MGMDAILLLGLLLASPAAAREPLCKEAREARDYSSVIRCNESRIAENPRDAAAFSRLGEAYYYRAFQRGTPEQGDLTDAEGAVDAYETALQLDPKFKVLQNPSLLYHGLAQCYDSLGRRDQALEAFQEAARLAPRNPMPLLYRARLYCKRNDRKLCIDSFQSGVRRARRFRVYPKLALLARTDPRFQGIMEVPQNQVILDSYDAVQRGLLSDAEARDRIQNADILRDAVHAALVGNRIQLPRPPAAVRPEAPTLDRQVVGFIDAGHIAFHSGAFRDAVDSYQAALSADEEKGALDPARKALLFERIGASYRRLGLVELALPALERTVPGAPQTPSGLYELALCHALKGDVDAALGALASALEKAPNSVSLGRLLKAARSDRELSRVRKSEEFDRILAVHSTRH